MAHQIKVNIKTNDGVELTFVLDNDNFCPSGQMSSKTYARDKSLMISGGFCLRLPYVDRREVHTIDIWVVC
jgi:hypothetical protein